MTILKPGDIVRFNITNRRYSPDGFALGGCFLKEDELEIFQTIDVNRYPSSNDFKGCSTIIKHDSYGIVLKKVGRPFKIKQTNDIWSIYDVYEIFTTKLSKRHVFKYNLERVLYY